MRAYDGTIISDSQPREKNRQQCTCGCVQFAAAAAAADDDDDDDDDDDNAAADDDDDDGDDGDATVDCKYILSVT